MYGRISTASYSVIMMRYENSPRAIELIKGHRVRAGVL